ncbi:MAG: TIGR03087 family PEP-CTERM/XrtA system glycosyltransferase [Magnetococcales bacterium]|nr:TIGR03087 family PEP-CTERM/XrtA system glycosyltransferase [Magnetococcales bacterium]
MDDLLFLAHRIPYPPRKGDKIRSYHLLRALTARYRVHLGAFVDDAEDLQHATTVANLCAGETRLVRLDPWRAKIRALRGLWRNEALTLPYYDHPEMRSWVRQLLTRHPIRRVVVYSAAPACFLENIAPGIRRVIDFVDVDSAKWGEYATKRTGLARWIYRREARTLLAAERRIAATWDAAFFVSQPEAELFRQSAPECAARVDYWENGVDLAYFSPDLPHANPYAPEALPLVFTGAMDYWPNVDAVLWFAETVFPRLHARIPAARFVIVGGRPTPEVMKLQTLPGIVVTGNVPDVRPWIFWAKAAVAPLRIARGIQNKVLEAMALERPVLATTKAMEGIRHDARLTRWVADTPDELFTKALALLQGADEDGTQPACGPFGRQWMQRHYHWESNLQRILDQVAG